MVSNKKVTSIEEQLPPLFDGLIYRRGMSPIYERSIHNLILGSKSWRLYKRDMFSLSLDVECYYTPNNTKTRIVFYI